MIWGSTGDSSISIEQLILGFCHRLDSTCDCRTPPFRNTAKNQAPVVLLNIKIGVYIFKCVSFYPLCKKRSHFEDKRELKTLCFCEMSNLQFKSL